MKHMDEGDGDKNDYTEWAVVNDSSIDDELQSSTGITYCLHHIMGLTATMRLTLAMKDGVESVSPAANGTTNYIISGEGCMNYAT